MTTLHYDGLGINATSGPLTGFRVAHVRNACHGFTEQERNELGMAMAAAPELLSALKLMLADYGPLSDPISRKYAGEQARAAIARATQP